MIDLPRVPAHVNTIFLTVTSYEGHTFEQIENAFCRLVDETNGQELARYTLSGGYPAQAMVMAKLVRHGGAGACRPSARRAAGRTALDLVGTLQRLV
jgi:tellurium resistance protein TerZ